MKIEEISIGDLLEIHISPSRNDSFNTILEAGSDIILQYLHDLDEWILINGPINWQVAGVGLVDQEKLLRLRKSGTVWVSFLAGTLPQKGITKSVVIGVRTFPNFTILPSDYKTEIRISDEVFDNLRKRISKQGDKPNKEILGWLTDRCIFQRGDKQAFLTTFGGGTGTDSLASFVLYGERFSVTIRKTKNEYHISKVTWKTNPTINDPIYLLLGKIEFVDVSLSTLYDPSGGHITPIDALVSENSDSYLQLWNQYNELERDIVIGRAQSFGWLHYNKLKDFSEGWRLSFRDTPQIRQKIERLCTLEEINLEISKFVPKEINNEISESDIDWENDGDNRRGLVVRCLRYNLDQCTIDVELFNSESMGIMEPPRDGGYIYVSIIGDRQRLIRRKLAWKRIKDLKAGIPGLKFLLEQPNLFASRSVRSVKFTEEELIEAFSGVPTTKQRMAVQIALTTPDIAVIQGPPGTGKTRVITALNKLLTSPKLNDHFQKGKILLTSYQHDAVENVANRTSVCGLPVYKLGKRQKRNENIDPIRTWRENQINVLKDDPIRSLDRPILDVLQDIQKMSLGYSVKPTTPLETASMLKDILNIAYVYLTPELIKEFDRITLKITRNYFRETSAAEELQRRLRSAVEGLRCDETSFMDDGRINASILITRMENQDLLSEEGRNLLMKAFEWEEQKPLDFLDALASLKQELLDNLVVHRLSPSILPNNDVEELLQNTIDHIQKSLETKNDDPELVIRRFMDDLEFDPEGIALAVQSYSTTIAATCQYAGSIQVNKFIEQEETLFDTVIIDEAARANPLDLLIPMSMAKGQVILLGDQRQLPHILEPDVEKQLNQSLQKTQEELRESLFNRLFTTLRDLGDKGPLLRIITLDMQFRMHPVLGQFISDTFYKKHNQEFRSDHLISEEFLHGIEKYKGKVAVWKEIPATMGLEQAGQSKKRPVEAEWIAEEAHRILQIDDKITVGVISFYLDQANEILSKMIGSGLTEEVEGAIQISRRYQHEIRGTERLRVGTVDAFQGKEFDVVILSMTRCNQIHAEPDDTDAQRKKYGFLTLENRLCVAMSRQKHLLIVAGDRKMIEYPAAEKAVPGLVEFLHLCEGGHGLFI